MATKKSQWITHRFAGGWSTDFGPTFYGAPDQSGTMLLPYLTEARNVYYEFDGGPHKVGGTTALNGTSLGSSSAVNGVYDYWRQGTGGTATQRVVAHVDTRIVYDSGGGTMTNLATGLTENATPNYSTFDDLLLIGSDSTVDVPRSWDQATFQNLAGSPPRFSFSTSHRNRQFAAGVWTAPSRLYFSVTLDPEDWSGGGSGSIDISPNDGDMITGIISHKQQLIIFKGPYRGSIHILTGSTSSDFTVTPFISGIGAVWQNSIFRFGDDIGWLSPFKTVHSLTATAAHGNYLQSYQSYPIQTHCKDNMNPSRLRKAWAVDDPTNSRVVLTYADSGQTNNDHCLMMDYRWLANGEKYPRWALWDAFGFASLGLVLDTNQQPRVYAGGYDGVIYKTDQADRTHRSAAITESVTTPYLTYGSELMNKTIHGCALGIAPKNTNNMTFGWGVDNGTQQTISVAQGGADTLG